MSDPVVLLSTGDVVGPAGGVTDNSMVLFSGTSGKLIKGNNAVVTAAGLALLDDVNAAAQMVTLGLTATATELNYTDGVTSAIQTQLNGKVPLAGGTMTGPIDLNRSGAIASGISWYSPSYNAWQEYMGQAGVASQGVRGNVTPPVGSLVSSWGRHSYIENSDGYGWVFESAANGSTTPTIMMELSSVTGAAKFAGAITAPAFNGALAGNASSASTLSGDQTNWASIRSNAVANMLGWKNYGNGHVIFDASNSTSPSGSAVNNVNSEAPWSTSYPTLMGWNGIATYGVRVDSARVADGTPWTGVSGKPTTLGGYGITDALSIWGGVVNGKTTLQKAGQVDWGSSSIEVGATDGGQAILSFNRHGVEAGTLRLNGGFYFDNSVTVYGAVNANNLFGQSQSWQQVSRAAGVTYTNDTGRPLAISIYGPQFSNNWSVFNLYISGQRVACQRHHTNYTARNWISGVVPIGATYQLNVEQTGIESWFEYR